MFTCIHLSNWIRMCLTQRSHPNNVYGKLPSVAVMGKDQDVFKKLEMDEDLQQFFNKIVSEDLP